MNLLFIHELADVQSVEIGTGTRIWQFVVVLPGATIGQDWNICSHCLIESDVHIGDSVTVKSGVQLWDGLRVSDDIFIGPNVTFSNDKFPRSKQYSEHYAVTVVKAGASIGGSGGNPAWDNDWRQCHGGRGGRSNQVGARRSHRRWQPRSHYWVRGV